MGRARRDPELAREVEDAVPEEVLEETAMPADQGVEGTGELPYEDYEDYHWSAPVTSVEWEDTGEEPVQEVTDSYEPSAEGIIGSEDGWTGTEAGEDSATYLPEGYVSPEYSHEVGTEPTYDGGEAAAGPEGQPGPAEEVESTQVVILDEDDSWVDEEPCIVTDADVAKANEEILSKIEMAEFRRGLGTMVLIFLVCLPILLIPIIGLLYFVFVPYVAGYFGGKRVPKRYCLMTGFLAGFIWSSIILGVVFITVTYATRLNLVVEPIGLTLFLAMFAANSLITMVGSWHGSYFLRDHSDDEHEAQIDEFTQKNL